jgi:hypothetical protein
VSSSSLPISSEFATLNGALPKKLKFDYKKIVDALPLPTVGLKTNIAYALLMVTAILDYLPNAIVLAKE